MLFRPFRAQLPIHIGGMGPKIWQMAGEVADGLTLGLWTTPAYTKYVLENLGIGARRAGKDLSKIEFSDQLLFSVSLDSSKAKQVMKRRIAFNLAIIDGQGAALRLKFAGVDEATFHDLANRVRSAYAQGDEEKAARLVPDDLVEKLSISGSPDECIEALKKFADAGVQVPVLEVVVGEDLREILPVIGKEVIPHIMES